MKAALTIGGLVLLAAGGFLVGYGLFAGEDEVAPPPERTYVEEAPCDGCPLALDSVEVQARSGSTLFIFGRDWPTAVGELSGAVALTANDLRVLLEPSAEGFILATAERAGSPIDPNAVAVGLQDGNLLVNLTDDVLAAPVTFALELTADDGAARLPRTGQLSWDGSGAPAPADGGVTEPEPEPEAERPEAFADTLAAAFRAGDAAFLVARLNPAVIEVYGEEQCTAFVAPDPTRAFVVLSVSDLEPFDYNPDGLSIPVAEAYTVVADVTAAGESAAGRELHFAPLGGVLTWFTDCGDPLTTG